MAVLIAFSLGAGFQQVLGAKQTPDMFGAERRGG